MDAEAADAAEGGRFVKALMWLKRDLRTIVIAVVAAAVTAGGPAMAHGVAHALFAHNADKVDGKHAVGSGAALGNAAGKLVTTAGNGKFAPKFITLRSFQAVNPAFDSLAGATSSGTALTIMTMQDLPAGTYVITGQVGVNSSGTTTSRVICETTLGSATTHAITSIGGGAGNIFQNTIPVTLRSTVGATSDVTLRCWTENLTGGAPFVSSDGTRLVAIKV
jgi:hypothetical protein